jgi:hypothetical protein
MSKLGNVKKDLDNRFAELDRKYPNRHKQIHKECCKQCPSAMGDDPETRDIKETCSKDFIVSEYLFVCAWRNSKLCKGNCDYNEIDQEYLDNYYSDEQTRKRKGNT